MKNTIESIKYHLNKIAKDSKTSSNEQILIRYFQESLLYRISISRYANNFFVKGGVWIYAIHKERSRPTRDIDFLAQEIKNDLNLVKEIFTEICQNEDAHYRDMVIFNTETIFTEEMDELDSGYTGVRIKVEAKLGDKTKQLLKIELGFGDVMTPAPIEIEYPTLLKMTPPKIRAYPIETVIAEKFEAMIDLAESNSRMKDFYDIYKLLKEEQYDIAVLGQAIHNTLKRRQTPYTENHPIFSPNFTADIARLKMWNAFLTSKKLDISLSFEEVMKVITSYLKPIYDELG